MNGRDISITAATTKKLIKVPIPGFSLNGIQKSKTPKLTSIIDTPIPIPNCTTKPCARTIQGLTPKFDPNNMACPKPKIERPKNKQSTDSKGGVIDNGVGALQNKLGTVFKENIFKIDFTLAS